MLISFSVANYRSFGEEQTLNMMASGRLPDHPEHRVAIGDTGTHALRTALIYGANAAGKSNLIRAMSAAQRLICGIKGAGFAPFRFDDSIAQGPSTFEFRFLVRDQIFSYGFDVTSNKILDEWLGLVRDGDDDELIFRRNADGDVKPGDHIGRMYPEDPPFKRTLEVTMQIAMRPQQLFLNRLGTLPSLAQGSTLRAIIRWLTEDLLVLEPGHRSCEVLERLSQDSEFRAFTEVFLKSVDTRIDRLSIRKKERESTEFERDWLPESQTELSPGEKHLLPYYGCSSDTMLTMNPGDPMHVTECRLEAEHRVEGRAHELAFSEESDGTQQLLHYVPILFTRKGENKVVVIDELDRSLHPLLCREFVRFFCDSCPGSRRQLIVTTHESQLLDQELLRRDEYWFVEKDVRQQSRLVPLSDYSIRNDLQIQKGYLQGRFGAIPIFGATDELRRLLDCEQREHVHAAEEAPTYSG